jgi:hypothetical protein
VLEDENAIKEPAATVKYSPTTFGKISAKEPPRLEELMEVLAKFK